MEKIYSDCGETGEHVGSPLSPSFQHASEDYELITRSGEHVATITVPEFRPRADALEWGGRMFFLDDFAPQFRYREGLTHVVAALSSASKLED